jgi:hypothetical protein
LHAGNLLLPLRGLKFIAQAVLWIPMFIGNTLASSIVRRTEFDADSCHARLAGRTTFETTLQRLQIIDFTWQGILAELPFLHREQQLPGSLPDQLQVRMIDMTPDLCSTLLETVVKPEEKPFDARPNHAERLSAIKDEDSAGVLECHLAATALLEDYEKLANSISWDYYVAAFGSQLLRTAVKPVQMPVPAH